MAKHIHKCPACSSYTLEKTCSTCNAATVLPRPPPFSPLDKYAKYRQEEKKKELKEKGLY